jgi:ferredoxin
MAQEKVSPIVADESKCAGCLVCELRCSLKSEQAFNPGRAVIRIRRRIGGENPFAIAFTETCDQCGLCARYCPYGALARAGAAA